MRRRLFVPLLLVFALAFPGCGLFGVGCGEGVPGFCFFFSGDCCKKGPNGFLGCGEFYDPFVYACGQSHGICQCVGSPVPLAVERQSRVELATYGLPTFSFDGGLPYAGMSPSQRLTFDVIMQSQQTYRGTVTYSNGFGFAGFTAPGGPGAQIGSYGFDFDANGVVDFALPLRALTADSAYVDVDLDGQATGVDPTVQHVANVPVAGAHTFDMFLPAGGDVAEDELCVPSLELSTS